MNLYLIGYRGSGKSTVASLVATQLDWECFDTDRQVELLVGQPISEIFAEYGERHFREWESTVVEALARQSNLVVATGGGVPLAASNRRWLQQGKVVWLRASPEVLWSRICQDPASSTQRPRLTEREGLDEVVQVLSERTVIYEACADYTIDTESLSPEQIAEQIASWFDPVDR